MALLDARKGTTMNAPDLTLSADYRVDDVCRRFEADWKAGRSPRLEEYLGDAADAERRSLLWELLRLEVEYRKKRGEQPAEEEYARRFPTNWFNFFAFWDQR